MCQKIIGLMLIVWCIVVPGAKAVGLEIAVGGWQQSIGGTLGYQPLGNPEIIDLDSNLQFDDETNLFGRAKIDLPLFFPNIYLVGAPAEFEGTGSKSIVFEFGDVTFNANAPLSSKIKVNQYDVGFYYGLPFVKTGSAGMLNVDIGLNVRILDLDASIVGLSGADLSQESQSITVPVPMLFLGVQIMPTDNFMIEAEGRGIAVDDNKLYGLVGRLRYQFAGPVFIAGGYRYDKIDVDEEGVVADIEFAGPFIELGVAF
jgi:outer membrane protein